MRKITYAEAIREALRQEMKRDENIFLIGEDIGIYGGAFGVTYGLINEFGEERVRDTPISELAIVGTSLGAAITGMRPIAEIMFMDFTTLAMEQIVNQAAKMKYMFGGKAKIPMVIRTPAGSGTGAAAQHSQSLEAWFTHVPGLKVVMPSTPYDAKGLLISSIRDDNPIIFIEHKLLYKISGEVPEEEYEIPLGVADIKREGEDLTIIATSIMVQRAISASKELKKEGISVEILDPRTLKPYDKKTIIESIKKTGKVIIVHEACKTSGFGAEIAAMISESESFDYLDAPIRRLGGLDIPIPYNRNLEKHAVPQIEDIINATKELIYG
ncbi:MAG: alpha-ketoacid dehydrogenase subunit beta [Actinomycetia bacterium]|nr:alpha-ketoacid dehydrogenase subunit beta [Actinomycetes bacterium]